MLTMELKVQAIKAAIRLLNLLTSCDDEEFVDAVVNAIYYNDVEPLWELEDNLR